MSIVTPEELKNFMSNISLDSDQEAAAQMVLDGVQAQLEQYLNRSVEVKERTETVTVDPEGYARLTASPVLSVASVVSPVEGSALTFYMQYGRVFVGYGVALGFGDPTVTVTYTAGLDGVNMPDLRLAVLNLSARIMENKHDDVLTNADLSTTAPLRSPLPELFTPEELQMVSRYRRRTVYNSPAPRWGYAL